MIGLRHSIRLIYKMYFIKIGVDLSLKRIAETVAKVIEHHKVWHYFKYIFLTVFGKGFGDRVRQDA